MSDRPDQLDPASIRVVNSPGDMATWPKTVDILKLELRPGRGLVVHCSDTSHWPDYHLDNNVDEGLCRYTLCGGFQIDGQWVMSGFFEYWAHEGRIRTDSGAHPLEFLPAPDGRNQFRANWAYPDRGWAPLDTFTPTPGVRMAVMLTAGDTRMSKTHTLSERSQIVTIPLEMDNEWDFPATTIPAEPGQPPAPPEPPGPPPVPSTDRLVAILEQGVVVLTQQGETLARIEAAVATKQDLSNLRTEMITLGKSLAAALSGAGGGAAGNSGLAGLLRLLDRR